ncbi:hypothetical protein PPNSA23_42200 [Phyllobacterium phragmitis]|uniref:Uncharacterized protein n=2 Tax=Phyllobacterium phragmitis TaxID=2670329 RepID=A0ABQ0H5S6_9HYPH
MELRALVRAATRVPSEYRGSQSDVIKARDRHTRHCQTAASALIVNLPELGQMDRSHVASLAGWLALRPNESGKKIGYRRM